MGKSLLAYASAGAVAAAAAAAANGSGGGAGSGFGTAVGTDVNEAGEEDAEAGVGGVEDASAAADTMAAAPAATAAAVVVAWNRAEKAHQDEAVAGTEQAVDRYRQRPIGQRC